MEEKKGQKKYTLEKIFNMKLLMKMEGKMVYMLSTIKMEIQKLKGIIQKIKKMVYGKE